MTITSTNQKQGRCVHCLRLSDAITADHVPSRSWYPDTTPETVQRWTVPACPECNNHLGQLEKDLLIRLALCIDPHSPAASGIAAAALRALGIDAEELSEKERGHREKLRARIRAELMPQAETAELPGKIPGLGPAHDEPSDWAIGIPWAALSIIAEKIARGCEYKLKERYIEPPYGLRTAVSESGMVPEELLPGITVFDLGPGCKIQRLFAMEDHNLVCYWITFWGTLNLKVVVDQETYLQTIDQTATRPQGIAPSENRRMMTISPYLRNINPQAVDIGLKS
jgi:5-methylcytosine-specific restriction endonuclease McrA